MLSREPVSDLEGRESADVAPIQCRVRDSRIQEPLEPRTQNADRRSFRRVPFRPESSRKIVGYKQVTYAFRARKYLRNQHQWAASHFN